MARREGGRWELWEGGRKWIGEDGKVAAFYIRKRVGGKRYEVRTPATTESAAHAHLKRFEADPEGYDPAGDQVREPLYLTDDLVREYLDFSKAEGNSLGWRRKQKRFLAWWAERLDDVDLRKADLASHILPPLRRATSRHHRIAILKGLYTWLRTEVHRISTAEDPVFGQLKVPQAGIAQLKKSKIIPRDHVLLAIEQLRRDEDRRRVERAARAARDNVVLMRKEPRDAPWSDALTLQAGTGWHTTEIARFAAEGTIEPLPRHAEQEGVAGVVVCPMRKSGEPQRTRVSVDALEAAKRLRAHGSISLEWYDRAVRAACAAVKRPDGKTGIPVFTPGRLRHSVASWAIDAGSDPAVVSAYLGHRSPRTTKKFYATFSAPAKVPTLV